MLLAKNKPQESFIGPKNPRVEKLSKPKAEEWNCSEQAWAQSCSRDEVSSAGPQCLQCWGCRAVLGLPLLPWAASGTCSSGCFCQGPEDGEVVSWVRMCLTDMASVSLHIPEAGLQSL